MISRRRRSRSCPFPVVFHDDTCRNISLTSGTERPAPAPPRPDSPLAQGFGDAARTWPGSRKAAINPSCLQPSPCAVGRTPQSDERVAGGVVRAVPPGSAVFLPSRCDGRRLCRPAQVTADGSWFALGCVSGGGAQSRGAGQSRGTSKPTPPR